MVNQQIVKLIESVLGRGIKLKKTGEYKFSCPAHKETHGFKLQIQLDDSMPKYQSYHCWVCSFRGLKLTSLFNKVNTSIEIINQLRSLLGITSVKEINSSNFLSKNIDDEQFQLIQLPEQFIPLWTDEHLWSPEYKHAKIYLRKRGITDIDILRYRIGYCEDGLFKNMVIIPSYDKSGNLNFYTGRAYYDNIYRKHRKPNISDNIIGFDLFINWKMPVILVEGVFDAISIKNNSIPLFGKHISEKLKLKLLQSDVPKIIFALDDDALNEGMKYAKEFMGYGKEVCVADLSGKDPSELGFERMQKILNNVHQFSTGDFLKQKILRR